jgi:hypothetical protein
MCQAAAKWSPRGSDRALMKHVDAEAGGRKPLRSWASRLASASAATMVLLLMGSGAKADHAETFTLSGSFAVPSKVKFNGTIDLDFNQQFTQETVTSIDIDVGGRIFKSGSLTFALSGNPAVVDASNSSGDTLVLMFDTLGPFTFDNFNESTIAGGQVIFGGFSGFLFNPTGVVTRDPLDTPIIDPPSDPPSAPVPELSTWAMMLVGLAGLGLAANGRRALAFLGGRA